MYKIEIVPTCVTEERCINAREENVLRLARWLGCKEQNEFASYLDFVTHVSEAAQTHRDQGELANPIEVYFNTPR